MKYIKHITVALAAASLLVGGVALAGQTGNDNGHGDHGCHVGEQNNDTIINEHCPSPKPSQSGSPSPSVSPSQSPTPSVSPSVTPRPSVSPSPSVSPQLSTTPKVLPATGASGKLK